MIFSFENIVHPRDRAYFMVARDKAADLMR
jgi:hypothetical protein